MRDVLFVRNDGEFAVAHIDSAGELVETHVGDDAAVDWTPRGRGCVIEPGSVASWSECSERLEPRQLNEPAGG